MRTETAHAYSTAYLDLDRLWSIPGNHWSEHEFCFFLHDQILHMLRDYEAGGVHQMVSDAALEHEEEMKQAFGQFDLIEILKTFPDDRFYKHHVISHVSFALCADMLNFLYEAFTCFEKRKFLVGLSLLRKPLKENLLYLSWIFADEDDFIRRFERDNFKSLQIGPLTPEEKIEIFAKAIRKLPLMSEGDATILWDMLYSKGSESSFEHLFQKSTHLVTSKGSLLKTEDYSFNLILGDTAHDNFYEFLYPRLSLVMLYMASLVLELFRRVAPTNNLTYNHLIIVAMGAFEALYFDGRSKQSIAKALNRDFQDIMKCVHCGAKRRILKSNAIRFYFGERMECRKCGLDSQFPLYWILGQGDIKILDSDDDVSLFAILRES